MANNPTAVPQPKAPNGPQAYRGNSNHNWVHVVGTTWRLRVPSGWLYQDQLGSAMTFVPMPEVVGYKI